MNRGTDDWGGVTTTHDVTGEYEVTITTSKHVALMLGGEADARSAVLAALWSGFELLHTPELTDAVEGARQCAPDVIILDAGAREAEVLDRLGADPLTESIPVLALSDQGGERRDVTAGREAAGRLVRPFEPEALRHMALALVTGPHGGLPALAGRLDDAALPEVLELIARELEFGVLAALGRGAHTRKLPKGRQLELIRMLASFIGQVRALFVEGPARPAGLGKEPERVGLIALSGEPAERPRVHDDEPSLIEVDDADVVGEEPECFDCLRGVRAVVADDDEVVRLMFDESLGAAGVIVELAANGREALDAIRRSRPDIVLADIVMPELSGWELIRTIRRDVLLCDLPVVVLSWREDYLQRMRELGADASQYVLKEADRSKVLAAVAAALESQWQMEALLGRGEPVVGRVEAVGVVPLLRLLAARPGGRRVTVRETWNLFSLVFVDGELWAASNETVGGERTDGLAALTALLGVRGGRFGVGPLTEPGDRSLRGALDQQLADAARPLQALIDQVEGGKLLDVGRVTLRDAVLSDYLEIAPVQIRDVVERLRAGVTPRALMIEGACSPQDVELIVVDMIRRGAIAGFEPGTR
jgi:CheY-like chemotaxis protein